ncbi:MAG: hypothetical protein M3503_02770 [Actinomycetota bacterium]|nr:hypothetical protein [Actinomycetota bacterium]
MANLRRMDAALVGRVLVGVGVVGVVLSLVAIGVGLRLLSGFDTALADSIALTADALDAVDASVEVTEGAVESLSDAFGRTEATTRQLANGIGDAVVVLDSSADLTEDEIAGSLEAVEGTLPALIDVAAVIDRTLSALSTVPFGPDYDPEQRFDDSLRAVQRELDGLPEALREQADLVREASRSLSRVQGGTVSIADDIGRLEVSLREGSALLEEYSSTARSARQVVERREQDLEGELRLARMLVVALGLTMTVANVAPLAVGWLLLRSDTPLRT